MSSVAEKLQRKSQRAVATKQVRLKLVYLDFWSTLKLAFLISVCAGIVLVVATILLDALQVFHALDGTLRDILDNPTFSIESSASLVTVAGFAFVVALLNVVVGTALGAIGSILYNFTVRLTGGLLVGFTNQ
jgi:uncharacterized membrane protein